MENNNKLFSYNNKVYKTEAAMKKAKTMDAKRASKQAKREAYAVSEKAFKRQQTDFSKQLLKIGSIYDEEKKKEFKINKQEKVRERKKYEPGQALGSFKIVYYDDNLYIKYKIELEDFESFSTSLIEIGIPNNTVIKNLIDNELRRQITSNNGKNKLSCFISIKFTMLFVDKELNESVEERWFNSSTTSLTSTHVLNSFINNIIVQFENCIENSHNTSNSFLKSVDRLEIKTAKSKAMVAGSYIELPEYIKNKRACVNIKNDDEKCFKWSILASKHYHEMKGGCKDKAYSYFKFEKELIEPENVTYPLDIEFIPEFEKLNKLKINVFELIEEQDEEENIKYATKILYSSYEKYKDVVSLLLFKKIINNIMFGLKILIN